MYATLTYNRKTIQIELNKATITDDLYALFSEERTPQYKRLKLDIHPKTDIVLENLEVYVPMQLASDDRIFCNGFQSWSESRLFGFNEKSDDLRWFVKPLMGYYGDYHFDFLPTKKGVLHSWTYGYRLSSNSNKNAQNDKQTIDFIGSLDESTAFTCLLYDVQNQRVIIKKDVAGLQLNHSFPALDVVILSGADPSVFDQYFALQNLPKIEKPVVTGWTSWYNYYNKISETIIEDNLNAFAKRDIPIDIFQIDDGWQTRIGDWLSIKPTFPNGMKSVANKIHQNGFKAGYGSLRSLWSQKVVFFKKKRTGY